MVRMTLYPSLRRIRQARASTARPRPGKGGGCAVRGRSWGLIRHRLLAVRVGKALRVGASASGRKGADHLGPPPVLPTGKVRTPLRSLMSHQATSPVPRERRFFASHKEESTGSLSVRAVVGVNNLGGPAILHMLLPLFLRWPGALLRRTRHGIRVRLGTVSCIRNLVPCTMVLAGPVRQTPWSGIAALLRTGHPGNCRYDGAGILPSHL